MINTISFIKLTNYCYRLKIPFDDIYTSVFLLTTEKGNVFVDCGTIPTDVTEYILPSLSLLGISAESVKGLFLTHSHSDHAGGLETFLENMPNITVFSFNREICNKYPADITLQKWRLVSHRQYLLLFLLSQFLLFTWYVNRLYSESRTGIRSN